MTNQTSQGINEWMNEWINECDMNKRFLKKY